MKDELRQWDWGTIALYWISCASLGLIAGMLTWAVVR